MEMSYLNLYFSSKVHRVCHSRHSGDPSCIKKTGKNLFLLTVK